MSLSIYTVMIKRADSRRFFINIKAASEEGALKIALLKVKWEAGTKLSVVDSEINKHRIGPNTGELNQEFKYEEK